MVPSRCDLHVHTYFSSDGDLSPEEIAKLACEAELAAIAVADHDTVAGVEESERWCTRHGIRLIPCVEISSQYQSRVLHLLAYFVELQSNTLLAMLDQIQQWELQRVQMYVDKLTTSWGFQVTMDEVLVLSPHGIPKLALIAKAIMMNGKNQGDVRLTPYEYGERANQPFHNFFLDYMNTGQPAYVPPSGSLSISEVISLVKECGGIPVLAHPGASLLSHAREEVLNDLVRWGLAGLEVSSSYHNLEEEAWYKAYAEHKGLLITAGSDFHGPTIKPGIRLGGISNNSMTLVDALEKYAQNL